MKFILKKKYHVLCLSLYFILSGLTFAADDSSIFDQLNYHVLGHSLKFLDARDLARFSATCRNARDISCSGYANNKKLAQKVEDRWYRHEQILRDPHLLAIVKKVYPNYLQQFFTSFEVNEVSFTFVMVPGGTYIMGSPANEVGRYGDEVQKIVKVEPLLMQQTLVTQAQWRAVMGNNPSHFQGAAHPVEMVSYNMVQEFITRLNGLLQEQGLPSVRLATEEEWEYAARAGTQTRFPWGDEESRLGEFTWGNHNAHGSTHDVATLEPNALGLYDMLGNVWEWTDSLWSHEDSGRVISGGGWDDWSLCLRPAVRGDWWPDDRDYDLGFRLVRQPN